MKYMSEQQQTCPECGKPVGNDHPGAKVYHMSCLMPKFEKHREELRKFHPKAQKANLDAEVSS
jgi:hypothetical protein